MRVGAQDLLAVELEDETEYSVSGGVLGTCEAVQKGTESASGHSNNLSDPLQLAALRPSCSVQRQSRAVRLAPCSAPSRLCRTNQS